MSKVRELFEKKYLDGSFGFLNVDADDLMPMPASEAGVEFKYEDIEVDAIWQGFKVGYEIGREDG